MNTVDPHLGEPEARIWLHELDPLTFSAAKMGIQDFDLMTDEEVLEQIDRLYPGGIAAWEASPTY
jgi:hypothetical protein